LGNYDVDIVSFTQERFRVVSCLKGVRRGFKGGLGFVQKRVLWVLVSVEETKGSAIKRRVRQFLISSSSSTYLLTSCGPMAVTVTGRREVRDSMVIRGAEGPDGGGKEGPKGPTVVRGAEGPDDGGRGTEGPDGVGGGPKARRWREGPKAPTMAHFPHL
jgi:hypothetical protein